MRFDSHMQTSIRLCDCDVQSGNTEMADTTERVLNGMKL